MMNESAAKPGSRRRGGRRTRVGVLIVGAAAAVAAVAGPASAHVKVSGINAVQGGSGVVTFRVPSESATASTVELLITFPSATPFTSVDTQPKAGWTAKVTKKPLSKPVAGEGGSEITQYVSQVDFKADSAADAIPPGEFDMFNLSVGPFPKSASVSFGALQTYSDGSQVNWDEQSADGVTQPAHPAPALALEPAATTTTQNATAAPAGDQSTASAATTSQSSWTGVTGLILGAIALLISLVTLAGVRGRRAENGEHPAS